MCIVGPGRGSRGLPNAYLTANAMYHCSSPIIFDKLTSCKSTCRFAMGIDGLADSLWTLCPTFNLNVALLSQVICCRLGVAFVLQILPLDGAGIPIGGLCATYK